MAETEPEKEKKAASPNAAENVIAGIFSFDPLKFLRTLRWVVREPDKIAEAIGSQTWDEILSPFKYFSACLIVFFVGWWVRSGETSAPAWSFTHIFIYIFFAAIVLPFLVAQYAYFGLVSAKKNQLSLKV